MHASDEPMYRQTPQKHDSEYNQQLVLTNEELQHNPKIIKKHASARLEHADCFLDVAQRYSFTVNTDKVAKLVLAVDLWNVHCSASSTY